MRHKTNEKSKSKAPPGGSNTCYPQSGCCSSGVPNETAGAEPNALSVQRRDFIKAMGLAATGLTLSPDSHLLALPLQDNYRIPRDKGLDPVWVRSLFERGEPEVHTGPDLVYIGMPVGGICAGQVYLGGDGRLWLWDIFNQHKEGVEAKVVYLNGQRIRSRDGANFVAPPMPAYPFEQGFGLEVRLDEGASFHRLDYTGFEDIRFLGQYPVGTVTYRDAAVPVEVELNAFSPFVPLDLDASSYPATVMAFTLKNPSDRSLQVTLSGWLENPVCLFTGSEATVRHVNRVDRRNSLTMLTCAAERTSSTELEVSDQTDYGSMALAALTSDEVQAAPLVGFAPAPRFDSDSEEAQAPFGRRLTGALGVPVTLAKGAEQTITFVVTWHFPNLTLRTNRDDDRVADWDSTAFDGRHYRTRFDDAAAVVENLAGRCEELTELTFRWRDLYYNASTLPHWLLNRTFWNVSTLATETCYRLGDGRFWAWEGVGCCEGTCTHVWHYAQAHARLFPEIEKILRAKTDFVAPAFDEETGVVYFRGNYREEWATDGQAGIVLRAYRDHLTAPDDTYLLTYWPKIKKATSWLIREDAKPGLPDGILEGEQPNTLDAAWYGKIPAITSLYLAALAAAAEMAHRVGDAAFAQQCSSILENGRTNFDMMFDGEYFVQAEDPEHPEAIGVGTGCHIDQVLGQSWALQLGLGHIIDEAKSRRALASLWTYNFAPDMGPVREAQTPALRGRPYALAGDKGLLMCTWPKGGKRDDWKRHWQFGYFNECMSGFEYQVASHMLWEGMSQEGLAVSRAIHDRYHPSKRNPYCEIECSDHYARAMASYGVYLAACGYAYDGPAGLLSFAPLIRPEDFKAAFTAAEGWGTVEQQQDGDRQQAAVELSRGQLRLERLGLQLLDGVRPQNVRVELNGEHVAASHALQNNRLVVHLRNELVLRRGYRLSLRIG